jgi:hypothetical protein
LIGFVQRKESRHDRERLQGGRRDRNQYGILGEGGSRSDYHRVEEPSGLSAWPGSSSRTSIVEPRKPLTYRIKLELSFKYEGVD